LYGFVATYFVSGVGILGALIVDPSKRNVSIGRSLHRRALRTLKQQQGLKKLQAGTSFPGVFLGVPVDVGSHNTREWLTNKGWDTQFPRRLTNMIIPDLSNWTAPEGLLQSIQRANITFDLIHGLENADSVLNHVGSNSNPEVLELYRAALSETKFCGIVRAKEPSGGLLGTIIISRQRSPLVMSIPPLMSHTEDIGGILAPVVPIGPLSTLTLQGLALMGIRQNKSHKALKTVLSWVRVY
jgi:beta-N-acetylhexosaminidase